MPLNLGSSPRGEITLRERKEGIRVPSCTTAVSGGRLACTADPQWNWRCAGCVSGARQEGGALVKEEVAAW